MDDQTVIVFFILVGLIFYYTQLNRVDIPVKQHDIDDSGHVKPEHLLYDVLKQFSSGDKISLGGKCNVNLYSKHIIDVNMKQKFTRLLNQIFASVYGITCPSVTRGYGMMRIGQRSVCCYISIDLCRLFQVRTLKTVHCSCCL